MVPRWRSGCVKSYFTSATLLLKVPQIKSNFHLTGYFNADLFPSVYLNQSKQCFQLNFLFKRKYSGKSVFFLNPSLMQLKFVVCKIRSQLKSANI